MTYRYLDLTRAAAAVLVLLTHSRAFALVDYQEVTGSKSIVLKSIYFMSGFGHEAVLIFFVLSGFLISGSVVKGLENGSWTWSSYIVSRLTRLLVVLVPCLCLTFILDSLAIRLTGSQFYAGVPELAFGSGPPRGGVSLGLATFVGNMLFLQTMWVPVLGSNGPLWSLANEFWYYALFPICYLAWSRRRARAEAIAYLILASVIAVFIVTPAVLVYFLVWLIGFLVFLADRLPSVRRFTARPAALVLACLAFAVAILMSRLNVLPALPGDFVFAACFALLMLMLLHRRESAALFRATDGVAAMSYSLYLGHFPVLAFLHTVVLRGTRFQPDATGLAVWIATATAGFLTCLVIYLLFESRTAAVRRKIMQRLGDPTRPRAGEFGAGAQRDTHYPNP